LIPKKIFSSLLLLAISIITLQLITGIWLFTLKYGLTPSQISTYFMGDCELFIAKKSIEGLIETAVPHFLAMSLTIFIFGHFLLFTNVISNNKKNLLITLLFITSSINIFSPFGIIYGFEFFSWLKIMAFWSFEILMGLLLYILFLASVRTSSKKGL